MIGWGVLIGAAIIALDVLLERRRATFRTPVLAVAIGIYLPLELSVVIFAGGLVSMFALRRKPSGGDAREPGGLLFAAGLITGEALIGIFMAIPIVVAGDPEVFALPWKLPSAAGLCAVVVAGALLYRVATSTRRTP
jgi:uncharacterized oligopeptide transporter (OPT) family protein